MGRPSLYETHIVPYMQRIPKMKKQGLTDAQIAYKLGVCASVFKTYKKDNPILATALLSGRMELIEDLEETLYTKALGGKIITKTKTTMIGKDKDNCKVETWKEELAPDTASLIFSLKNLSPEHWQDRRVVDASFNHKEIAELRSDVASFGMVKTNEV